MCEFLKEARIERAGVFPYSPEEGTPAEKMDRPDEETARMRAESIAALQEQIMEQYNRSRIGTEVNVLVEDFDGKIYSGRSYAESPDIDGLIHFTAEETITGDFARVTITGIVDGEPFGVGVPDEEKRETV